MANYVSSSSVTPFELRRVKVIPQIAPTSPPHLAVSRKPGPVIRGVPVRVGGQSGSWEAPLLIRRAPLGYELGTRQGSVGSVLGKAAIGLLKVIHQSDGMAPALLPVGPRIQEGGNVLIPIGTPSTDINAAVDISAFSEMGIVVQPFTDIVTPAPTLITEPGDAGGTSGTAYDLGVLPDGGIDLSGASAGGVWEYDYYKFRVATTCECLFTAAGVGASEDTSFSVAIQNAGGSTLQNLTATAGQYQKSITLTAGTDYYLWFPDIRDSIGTSVNRYTLRILPITRPYYYYKFTTPQPGRFDYRLVSSDDNAWSEVGIRNLSGSDKTSKFAKGTFSQDHTNPIVRRLGAGDWYIFVRVAQAQGATLTLNASFKEEPGDSSTYAYQLGTLSGSRSVAISMDSGLSNTSQWFKFTTNSTAGGRTFSRTSNFVTTTYMYSSMTLYAADGSTQLYSTQNASFSYSLAANTSYHLRVSSWGDYAYANWTGTHTLTIA